MPGVPAIVHGMPRAVKWRMSAPHGTPERRVTAAELVRERGARRSGPRVVRGVSAGANSAAPRELGRAARRHRAPPPRPPRSAAGPPRSAPTGTPSRPSNSTRSGTWLDHAPPATRPDEQRVRQLQLAHQRVRHVGVHRELVLGERGVDGDVAVDRRAALEPRGGVGGAAADHAAEGQRAGLRADDAPAGRLGDQGGVEGASRWSSANVPRPPSSSELAHCTTTVGRALRPTRGSPRRVQRRDDGALHVDGAAAVQTPSSTAPLHGPCATGPCPGRRRRRGR